MSQSYASLIKATVGQGDGYLALSHSKDPKLNGLKTEFYHSSQVPDFMSAVEKYKDEQVYFGLGLRSRVVPDGKRGAREDISSISIIGMDVDIYDSRKPHKKLPKTYDEAIALLQGFPLPPSLIIDSGSGLHSYIFLRETLTIQTESEREAAQELVRNFYGGFAHYAQPYEFDSTFDITRILRVPGTLNLKDPSYPREVKILFEDCSRTYSIDEIEAVGFSGSVRKERAKKVIEGGVNDEAVGTMNLKRVISGCSWFERVWAHPETATYSEWFATSSVLFFAENGNAMFHEWSGKHPKYSYDESQALWEQIDPERARRTCDSVSSSLHGAVDCERCPFHGGIHSPVELGLPEKRIVVTQTGSLPTKAAQAWAATYVTNEPPTLFRNNVGILRINAEQVGWDILNPKSARHEFARSADWMKPTKSGSLIPSDPAEAVIEDMLQTIKPPLPELKKVTSIPVITTDGRLVQDFGYDETSKIYRTRDVSLGNTKFGTGKNFATAQEAVKFILEECLVDFPFGSEQDSAHALALMLHDFARNLFGGVSPLFLLDKPVAGSGASLLATTLLYPSLGSEVPMKVFSKSEEERRKQITTHLYSGGGPYVLDNVSGDKIDSDVLAAVLTSVWYSDRLLGGNTAPKLPNLGPWVATGNNPRFSGQLNRRFVEVRLVPKTETPHLRDGFRHYPLMPWVKENRALLIDACITIVMAYVEAGRPSWDGTPLGSFEEFSKVMGGILQNAGVEGFMSDMALQRDSLDAENSQLHDFVDIWWEEFGERQVPVKDLMALAAKHDLDVQDHWVEPGLRTESTRSESTKAGNYIGNKKQRYFVLFRDGESVRVQLVKTERRSCYGLRRG